MRPLVSLLGIVLAAMVVLALYFGLERWLRRPGLALLLSGITMLFGSILGIAAGQLLQPALFLASVPLFFYSADERRTAARTKGAPTPTA